MNININIIYIALAILIVSCKKEQNEKVLSINNTKHNDHYNLDNYLKCSDYISNGNFFYTPDYGCIYNPKEKYSVGNSLVYLIPLNKNYSFNENDINSMSIEQMKEAFKILIYLVKPNDLNYNLNGDPPYYPKEIYTGFLYTYDISTKKWKLLDNKFISHQKEEADWLKSYLPIDYNKEIITSIKQDMNNAKLTLYIEQDIDINQDNIGDKILIFKNNKEFVPEDENTQNSPIYILLGNEKGYTIYKNNKIFKSTFGYDLHQVAIKNNYMTIELYVENSEIDEQKLITFKYDSEYNDIILDKLEGVIIDNDKNIFKYIYTKNDFELIKFNDFNSNTIQEKLK